MTTSITSLSADPFLLELTTGFTAPDQACDCVGNLSFHGTDISCTVHQSCQRDHNLYRVCISCSKRYCSPCFNDVHQHPMLNGCHTISWLSYTNSRSMYQRFGTPNQHNSLTMTLGVILEQHKYFYKKAKAAKHCRNTIRILKDKYGNDYTLTFLEFLRQYTQSTALFFTPVDVTETRKFHSLNACGRYWYGCSKRTKNSTSSCCFPRMLRQLRTDQGENVSTIMTMMYHCLLLNLIGLVLYGLMLVLPFALSSHLRDNSTNGVNWADLTTGVGIHTLPIGYGGFPDTAWAPTPGNNSGRHFVVLLPIYAFLVFAIGAVYTVVLILNNRQSLSETVSSPALLGNVSTTAFTMFEHNLANTGKNAKQAQQNFDANIRMSLIKKFNPDQKQSAWQKFASRKLAVMFLSILLTIAAAVLVVIIDYYGLTNKYGQRYLKLGLGFQQLIFPFIFWIIKYLTEQLNIFFVRYEVPKQLNLYNRFRSVLFYRFNISNMFFLIALIVISFLHRNDVTPLYQSINVSRQVDLGYCNDTSECICPPQTIGMFWYRILITGFYFEIIMILLSIVRTVLTRCFVSNSAFYFSPIPRLSQFYFVQSLVWVSILFLPASPVLGFLITLIGWFFSYFKIQVLKLKPESGVYLLPSKIQFYFAFILLIMIAYVPTAILFTWSPECGAFVESKSRNLTAFALFNYSATDFPVVIKEVFSYATNPLVLWLVIIASVTAIISLRHVSKIGKKTRNKLITRLKLESHERVLLIKRLGVDYKDEDNRGEKLFLQWMMDCLTSKINANNTFHQNFVVDSSKMLKKYFLKIQAKHPNFIHLSKHSEEQLHNIFMGCGCPNYIADLLVISYMSFLRQYKNQMIMNYKKTL